MLLSLAVTPAYADNSINKYVRKPTLKEKEYLIRQGVDLDNIVVLKKEKVFNEAQLNEMDKFDKSKKDKGTEKTFDISYMTLENFEFFMRDINRTEEQTSDSGISLYAVEPGPGDGAVYYIDTSRSYTHLPKDHDVNEGMRTLVDRAFSVALGLKTSPYIWVPATMFDIEPSDFWPTYISGDRIFDTLTEDYNDRHYRQYSPILGYAKDFVRTTKYRDIVYQDLYTRDLNNNAVRYSDVHYEPWIYSDHYFDTDWIYSMCNYFANESPYQSELHDNLVP